MRTILILSATGGCMTLFYLLYVRTLGGTLKSRRIWLTAAALLYLAPLRILRQFYVQFMYRMSGSQYLPGAFYSELRDYFEVQTEKLVYHNEAFRLEYLVFGIWVTIAAIRLFRSLILHFKKKRLIVASYHTAGPEQIETLKELKASLKIKRRVHLVFLEDVSPVTIGCINPVIVLPEKMRENLPELVLKHELTHIKNGDMLLKVVLTAITNIHWFNPLAYRLERELEKVYEMMCDVRAVQDCSDQEKLGYLDMLLQESKAVSRNRVLWSHHLTKEAKFLKERIENVMDKKKIGKIRKCVCSVVMAAAVFTSSLTALAYEDVHNVGSENSVLGRVAVNQNVEFNFSTEGEYAFDPENIEEAAVPILYDVQFFDEEGNVYPGNLGDSPNSICKHKFVSGICSAHTKAKDGSCTVYYYNGEICEICGDIILYDLIKEVNYPKCPH